MPHHGRSPWPDRFDYRRRRRPGGRAARRGRPGGARRTLDGRQGGHGAGAAAPRLVERLCVVDVAPVDYASRERVRRLHRRDAGPGPDATRAGARRGRGAGRGRAEPDRAELPAAEPPARRRRLARGSPTSTCSAATWRRSAAGRRRHSTAPRRTTARRSGSRGDARDYIRAEYAAAMERWFPRIRKVTVKDAGHWVHSEQPEVFVEVLRRFLAAALGPPARPVGRDRVAVAAGGRAETPGPVAGQVEHDALAVVVGADRRAGTARRRGSRRSSPSRSRPTIRSASGASWSTAWRCQSKLVVADQLGDRAGARPSIRLTISTASSRSAVSSSRRSARSARTASSSAWSRSRRPVYPNSAKNASRSSSVSSVSGVDARSSTSATAACSATSVS